VDVDAYLVRIGYEDPLAPTAAALAALQKAHLLTVPFESLDQHFGVPISLEPEELFDKIVTRRRGGFCYELNGLFAALLAELGFQVSLLEARPFRHDGTLAPRFAHLAVGVTLERRWLVDVGFGYWSPSPLEMDAAGPQRHGRRRFQVTLVEGDGMAEELGRSRRYGYAFNTTPRAMADFAEQCRWYATDPESGFVANPPVSLAFPDGWITVTPREVIGYRGDVVLDRPIADARDWRRTLRELLGVAVA
jgi:N-hydroxyarylamine O-acetyltransferase